MNNNLERMKKDLKRLIDTADLLYYNMLLEFNLVSEDLKEKLEDIKVADFKKTYDIWYSESLQVIKQLLPDRLDDFVKLYKNEKRKEIDWLTYTISDYLIGLQTSRAGITKVDGKAALPKFEQQKNIIKSAERRFESSLFDIKQVVQADIFDDELDTASELLKKGFIRAAGAIAGVVLEKHLKEICGNRKLKSRKKNPTINDFNNLLKSNYVIEVPTWRLIQHLGDIRNICDHSKERDPKKEEVEDLIQGVNKISKSVY